MGVIGVVVHSDEGEAKGSLRCSVDRLIEEAETLDLGCGVGEKAFERRRDSWRVMLSVGLYGDDGPGTAVRALSSPSDVAQCSIRSRLDVRARTADLRERRCLRIRLLACAYGTRTEGGVNVLLKSGQSTRLVRGVRDLTRSTDMIARGDDLLPGEARVVVVFLLVVVARPSALRST